MSYQVEALITHEDENDNLAADMYQSFISFKMASRRQIDDQEIINKRSSFGRKKI
jgi:hypothetical protein